MDKLFLTILNMSLTGAFVIAAICIARLPLKKAPKIISYCLWTVAGFRLVFPYSIESIFSLIPFKTQPIPQDIATQAVPRIDSGIVFLNNAVSGMLPAAAPTASVNPLQILTEIGAYTWFAGAAVLLIYGAVSFFIIKRKMSKAAHIEANIFEAENIKSPFVLGIFKPNIYLPAGLSEQEKSYVTLHEQTHIKRRDHIVKFAAYFVLCLHWFNPFAWAAFLLMGVDMEMSCDERVLKEMGGETKKEYSLSLLSLATERRVIGGTPLAFGEGGIKERIKNVLNFKKSSRAIIVAAVVLAAVLSVGFAMNRSGSLFPMTMNTVQKEPHFAGVVTEVNENSILVHVNEGEDARRSSDLIYVSLDVKLKDSISTWFEGDEVIVYYNGMIAETYPAQVNTVYAIVMKDESISMNSMIMLDDLRELAAKGDALMFDDFQNFRGGDASSNTNYHIMIYSVEGGYRLIVRSKSNSKPDSVNLESIWEGGGSGIDIRYNDVDEYIRTHPSHPAFIGEVAQAVAEEYVGKELTYIDVEWWEYGDEFPHNSKDPFKQSLRESLDKLGEACELFMDAEGGFIAVVRKTGAIYTYIGGEWHNASSSDMPPISTYEPLKWLDYYLDEQFPWNGSLDLELPEYPDTVFIWQMDGVTAIDSSGEKLLFSGMPVWNVYLADLNGDNLPEFCATTSFGSGLIDTRVIVYDYTNDRLYDLSDRGYYDYFLSIEDSQLVVTQARFLDNLDNNFQAIGSIAIIDGELVTFGIDRTLPELPPEDTPLPDASFAIAPDENPFSDQEIEAAKAVVKKYFEAWADKDEEAWWATWGRGKPENAAPFGDWTITLKDIRFDSQDSMRESYIKHGRGSINNTSIENVIVFKCDFNVHYPDGIATDAFNEGDYTDWSVILIRQDADSQWFVDDNGY